MAPTGKTFSGSVSATGHAPFTFSVAGNGMLTYGQLLGQLNGDIANGLGIQNWCTNPTSPSLCAPTSSGFDPDTVTIQWDGNTAFDLANFGLQEVPAPSPEPSSLLLLGTGALGLLGPIRRKLLPRK